jgi:TldD protein
MNRKNFLQMAGMGLGSLALPRLPFGTRMIDPSEALQGGMDVASQKAAGGCATECCEVGGATYADVRIGRYLNQFVTTRENRVQNIANTESFGVGIRVIANGSWGFAATNDVTPDGDGEDGGEGGSGGQGQCEDHLRAGAAGAAEGIWGSELEDADRQEYV